MLLLVCAQVVEKFQLLKGSHFSHLGKTQGAASLFERMLLRLDSTFLRRSLTRVQASVRNIACSHSGRHTAAAVAAAAGIATTASGPTTKICRLASPAKHRTEARSDDATRLSQCDTNLKTHASHSLLVPFLFLRVRCYSPFLSRHELRRLRLELRCWSQEVEACF